MFDRVLNTPLQSKTMFEFIFTQMTSLKAKSDDKLHSSIIVIIKKSY